MNRKKLYIILLIITTLWMGVIGFVDDYIKKFKNDKNGLKGRFKIIGQVVLGIIVGLTLFFNSDVTIKEKFSTNKPYKNINILSSPSSQFYSETKSTKTTIPFFKENEFDYADLITWVNPDSVSYTHLTLPTMFEV